VDMRARESMGPSASGKQPAFMQGAISIAAKASDRSLLDTDKAQFLWDALTTMSAEQHHLMRACPVQNVLHLCGKILADPGGSAWTYGLSRPVEYIDAFISHNWSVGRWIKFLVCAFHFNLRAAAISCVCLSVLGFVLTFFGVLPRWKVPGSREPDGYLGQVLLAPIFLFILCCASELKWVSYFLLGRNMDHHGSSSTKTAFLDKTCIHQTDPVLKQQGIVKLGAFLALSRHMVVCYTNAYLRKLWTVYEIACFLVMHPLEDMTIIHTDWALTCVCGVTFFYLNNLRYFYPPLAHSFMFLIINLPMGFIMAFWLRFVLKELKDAKDSVANFSVREAKCFCEDDRSLVEGNISLLLKHSDHVDMDAPLEETLEVFNTMVRENLPIVLKNSMGTSGVPYHFLLIMFLPLTCSVFMDNSAARAIEYGFFHRETVLTFLYETLDGLVLLPCGIQTMAKIMSRFTSLHGWKEKLYVVCTCLMWSILWTMFGAYLGYFFIVRPAIKTNSGAYMVAFAVYVLAWIFYALLIFGGKDLIKSLGKRDKGIRNNAKHVAEYYQGMQQDMVKDKYITENTIREMSGPDLQGEGTLNVESSDKLNQQSEVPRLIVSIDEEDDEEDDATNQVATCSTNMMAFQAKGEIEAIEEEPAQSPRQPLSARSGESIPVPIDLVDTKNIDFEGRTAM